MKTVVMYLTFAIGIVGCDLRPPLNPCMPIEGVDLCPEPPPPPPVGGVSDSCESVEDPPCGESLECAQICQGSTSVCTKRCWEDWECGTNGCCMYGALNGPSCVIAAGGRCDLLGPCAPM